MSLEILHKDISSLLYLLSPIVLGTLFFSLLTLLWDSDFSLWLKSLLTSRKRDRKVFIREIQRNKEQTSQKELQRKQEAKQRKIEIKQQLLEEKNKEPKIQKEETKKKDDEKKEEATKASFVISKSYEDEIQFTTVIDSETSFFEMGRLLQVSSQSETNDEKDLKIALWARGSEGYEASILWIQRDKSTRRKLSPFNLSYGQIIFCTFPASLWSHSQFEIRLRNKVTNAVLFAFFSPSNSVISSSPKFETSVKLFKKKSTVLLSSILSNPISFLTICRSDTKRKKNSYRIRIVFSKNHVLNYKVYLEKSLIWNKKNIHSSLQIGLEDFFISKKDYDFLKMSLTLLGPEDYKKTFSWIASRDDPPKTKSILINKDSSLCAQMSS